MHSLMLGASLYVPATHPDLLLIANNQKIQQARSLIFCTEDAVSLCDLPQALDNLANMFLHMEKQSSRLRFVRVRSPEILKQMLTFPGIDKLTGFVLPKFTRHNLVDYFKLLQHTRHYVMPTLETVEVFDEKEMRRLRRALQTPNIQKRIMALRIGGNDLFSLLGLRRPNNTTIYQTPLGQLISRLIIQFRPYGFALTSPVFEYINQPELLAQEVLEDVQHGLIGKTAIHPSQINIIEEAYQVCRQELASAKAIIAEHRPAVFQMNGAMCEPATHENWAQHILQRAQIYGTGM